MPSTRKFYRAEITLEILCEEPYLVNGPDLEDIAYDIGQGDCSGTILHSSEAAIDAPTAAKLLQAQGSDPEFFRIDADGNDIDE